MRAPYAEQLKLLDLQPLDTKLAKLAYKRKNLPEAKDLAEMQQRDAKLAKLDVQARAQAEDIRRELKSVEMDIDQVKDRYNLQNERLNQGTGSPRELVALQGEVSRLKDRIGELEESQMTLMDKSEKARATIEKVQQAQEATAEKLSELEDRLKIASGEVDTKIAEVRSQREQVASGIDADLLDEYEDVRSRTGGTGVIGMRGPVCPDLGFELSAAQWDQLVHSDPDEVIHSEDYDYILVYLKD